MFRLACGFGLLFAVHSCAQTVEEYRTLTPSQQDSMVRKMAETVTSKLTAPASFPVPGNYEQTFLLGNLTYVLFHQHPDPKFADQPPPGYKDVRERAIKAQASVRIVDVLNQYVSDRYHMFRAPGDNQTLDKELPRLATLSNQEQIAYFYHSSAYYDEEFLNGLNKQLDENREIYATAEIQNNAILVAGKLLRMAIRLNMLASKNAYPNSEAAINAAHDVIGSGIERILKPTEESFLSRTDENNQPKTGDQLDYDKFRLKILESLFVNFDPTALADHVDAKLRDHVSTEDIWAGIEADLHAKYEKQVSTYRKQ